MSNPGKGVCCIRQARPEDAAVLAGIYAPYVRDTAITFEYDPPDAAEFARRIRKTQEQFPYLVCEVDGKPQAYAYASHFHERAAFQLSLIHISSFSLKLGGKTPQKQKSQQNSRL